jgi:hypothetical protein
MRQRHDGGILTGIAVLAALCMMVCSGCLKGSGDDGADNETDAAIHANDVTPTNGVTDETGGQDSETNGTDGVTGGETNGTGEVTEEEDGAKVYVAVGECMTVGGMHPGPGYVEILEGMLGVEIINEGRDSEGSKQAAARLPSVLARHHPDYLLILYGTMDATGQWDIEGFYPYYYQMVKMTLDADCIPVLATFPPQLTTKEELDRGMQLNAEIRRVAVHYGIPLVDLEKAFDFRPSLYLPDLWHPNGQGSQLIAQEFYRVLR